MNKNNSIKCNVTQCKYNDVNQKNCTLNVIEIGSHEANPKKIECTDCNSFELK